MKRWMHAAQRPALALGLLLGGSAPSLQAQAAVDPVGDWVGSLSTGAAELQIVFHIVRADDGTLTTTMDSPDQGALGIPTGSTTLTADTLNVEIPAIAGRFQGMIVGDTLAGVWRQGAGALPLVMVRGAEVAQPNRPQEPGPPFPYREEGVSIPNPDAPGVTLAGTLTIPEGAGPFPGVVLVTGSGPQDRDEALMGHRPFAVLADALTRGGVAVLRYDDRGFAESTGDFAAATSEDFASDAVAAADWLRARPEVEQVGIVGHSEGGLVAAIVGAEHPDRADFLVLLAGTAVAGDSILTMQTELIMQANGAPPAMVAANRRLQEIYIEVAGLGLSNEEASARAREMILPVLDTLPAQLRTALEGGSEENRDQGIAQNVAQLNTPWFRYFLQFDPSTALREVQVPVLALNGSLDLQVPSAVNLEAIERALREGGNDAVTIRELPGLNHLFQTATTGSPNEYAQIEETMSPVVWETILAWVRGLGQGD